MKRIIYIAIIASILLGCESTFSNKEEGELCKGNGTVYSKPDICINGNNYRNDYQYQYYQFNDTQPCQRRQCIDGKWVVDPEYSCANSCKKPVNIDIDLDNVDQLDIEKIEKLCNEFPKDQYYDYCGECKNGEWRCNDDNTIVQFCENGVWTAHKNCLTEFHTSCVMIDKKASCGSCINGDERIYNNTNAICQRSTCENAKWIIDEGFCAKHDVSCTSDDKCGECRNGNMRCDDGIEEDINKQYDRYIRKCLAGEWIQFADCLENSCTRDDSSSDNLPNSYICGECQNGKTKLWHHSSGICISSTCNNGKWVDDLDYCGGFSCITDENGNPQKCGKCLNNTQHCDKDTKILQLCQNGTYIDLLECNSCKNDICSTDKTDIPDDKCQKKENSDIYLAYSSNGEISICLADCIVENNEGKCKDCVKDEYNQIQNICYTKTCNDGSFGNTNKCLDIDVSCKGTPGNYTGCGECMNNSFVYSYSDEEHLCTYKECELGTWIDKKCADNVSCLGTAPNYTGCGECKNDDEYYSMISNVCQHYQCTSGKWNINSCNNASCLIDESGNYTGCGECINDTQKCVETDNSCTCQKCENGQWKTICQSNSCSGTAPNYTGCGVCKNGETKYTMNGNTCQTRKCVSGKWEITNCSGNNSCKGSTNNYTGCGECINGSLSGFYQASDKCLYNKKCVSGTWQDIGAKFCQDNPSVSCKKSGGKFSGCGECYNPTPKCVQGYRYDCVDGVWSSQATFCPKGCDSKGTDCKW